MEVEVEVEVGINQSIMWGDNITALIYNNQIHAFYTLRWMRDHIKAFQIFKRSLTFLN